MKKITTKLRTIRSITTALSLGIAAFGLTVSPVQSAVIYDLAADWSDVSNPNGVWSYNGTPGAPITTNLPDWDPVVNAFFGSAQPAWATARAQLAGHVPMFFKRVSDTSPIDVPIGRVGLHGATRNASEITWTSPTAGVFDITGGTWLGDNGIGRNIAWNILLNGASLTSGLLTPVDPFDSATPFDFLTGTGGSAVLTSLALAAGDIVSASFTPSGGPFQTFTGIDLTITQQVITPQPVPEPATLTLFGLGLAGLGFARRRRKLAA